MPTSAIISGVWWGPALAAVVHLTLDAAEEEAGSWAGSVRERASVVPARVLDS
jgi:hypothetical protein